MNESTRKEWEYFKMNVSKTQITIPSELHLKERNIIKEDLRIIKDNKIGTASCYGLNLGREKLEKNIFNWRDNFIEFPSDIIFNDVNIFDRAIVDLNYLELISIGNELMKRLNVKEDLVVKINKMLVKKQYKNSKQLNLNYRKTLFSINIFYKNNNNLKYAHKHTAANIFDINKLADSISNKIKLMNLPLVNLPENHKSMPVIIQERALLGILIPLRKFLDLSRNNFINKSDYNNSKLFNNKLNVIDDPTIYGYENSFPFDDEGIAGKRKHLIMEGKLLNKINCLSTANKYNKKPTGNGIRSFNKKALKPRFSNMIVKAGKKDINKVISNINKGIIVRNIVGSGINNFSDGRIIIGINSGFRISRGKIIGRIKNVVLKGNLFNILRGYIELGNRLDYVHNGIYSPPILIEGFKIEKK